VPVADREPGEERSIQAEGARGVHDVETVLLIMIPLLRVSAIVRISFSTTSKSFTLRVYLPLS